LRLVHAVPPVDTPMTRFEDVFRADIMRIGRESVMKLQEEAGSQVELCMEMGSVPKVVRAAALHHQADLVMIGHGKVLATENWEVAPHPVRFRAEQETMFSLILVGNVAAEDRERLAGATAFAGWRRRLRCTPSMGLPYAEMRRDGPLDAAIVQEVSRRLNCSAVGLEVPGAARGFHWASAWKGDLEDSGEARSAVEFAQILHPLSFQIGETPGMLFGRGGGWLAVD